MADGNGSWWRRILRKHLHESAQSFRYWVGWNLWKGINDVQQNAKEGKESCWSWIRRDGEQPVCLFIKYLEMPGSWRSATQNLTLYPFQETQILLLSSTLFPSVPRLTLRTLLCDFSYNCLWLLSLLIFPLARAHLPFFHSCKLTSTHEKFRCNSSTLLIFPRINSSTLNTGAFAHSQHRHRALPPWAFSVLSLRTPLP